MRIVKHIPNTITSTNLLCGVLGVICTLKGSLDTAFILMLAAAVCDFCDGLAARLLKAYSELGKQLDSLADMVSFGVLPSLMMYSLMVQTQGDSWICYVPLLIAVFSALRLAKFNIDERQSDSFIGLATPACAIICGAFAYYVCNDPASTLASWAATRYFIPFTSVTLCILLVSEIPMFSMKFKKNILPGSPMHKQRIAFVGVMVVASVLVLLLGLNWSMIILLTFVSYIVMNIGIMLMPRAKKGTM